MLSVNIFWREEKKVIEEKEEQREKSEQKPKEKDLETPEKPQEKIEKVDRHQSRDDAKPEKKEKDTRGRDRHEKGDREKYDKPERSERNESREKLDNKRDNYWDKPRERLEKSDRKESKGDKGDRKNKRDSDNRNEFAKSRQDEGKQHSKFLYLYQYDLQNVSCCGIIHFSISLYMWVFVEPTCSEWDIVVQRQFGVWACISVCVCRTIRIRPDHNFYYCGWISK